MTRMTTAWLSALVLAATTAACGGNGSNPDGAPAPDGGGGDAGSPDGGGGDGGAPDGGGGGLCAATEACDGVVDDDCDGTVDEGCGRCPLLTVACPAGCCAVDRWEVDTVDAVGASLAVADDGTIYMTYAVQGGGGWASRLAVYDPEPGTWRLVTLGAGTYRTRVRLDGQGRLHLVYGSSGGPLYYRRSDDRGVTLSTQSPVGTLNIGGVFDLEIDSAGQPHVAYGGDDPYSYSAELRYAVQANGTWTNILVDGDSGDADNPDLELGFADRPHILYRAYNPPGGSGQTTRYAFYNGNRWIYEPVDALPSGETYDSDDYFWAHSLRLDAADRREILFTRAQGGVSTLLRGERGPADADTWQVAAVPGATGALTPVLFVDAQGARGAVSDGLRLHREAGATWTSADVGVPGHGVAVARRGQHLYLAYTGVASGNGPPTVTIVDLGP